MREKLILLVWLAVILSIGAWLADWLPLIGVSFSMFAMVFFCSRLERRYE